MGPVGFFPWITKNGYTPSYEYISAKSRLLVDASVSMYRYGYAVPLDSPNFHQEIVNSLILRFGHFAHVTFMNDGKLDETHPKYQTQVIRREKRKAQKEEVEIAKRFRLDDGVTIAELKAQEAEDGTLQPYIPPDEEEQRQLDLKFDKKARAARGVSAEDSQIILTLLNALQRPNFTCVQLETGEADSELIRRAKEFDYVVSEDADLICGGIDNFLRGFCTQQQAVYKAKDILRVLKLSLRQMQEIVCISGNDYKSAKIGQMGLKTAYELILKHKNCTTLIPRLQLDQKSKFKIPENFTLHLEAAIALYNPEKCLPLPSA